MMYENSVALIYLLCYPTVHSGPHCTVLQSCSDPMVPEPCHMFIESDGVGMLLSCPFWKSLDFIGMFVYMCVCVLTTSVLSSYVAVLNRMHP